MKYLFSIVLTICILVSSKTVAQEVDYNSFIKETQISLSGSGKVAIVWWIPVEFWKVTFSREKNLSEVQKNEFIKILKPYTIFAIVNGKIGPMGGITFTPVDSIEQTIELIDKDGIIYKPLPYESISPDIQNLLLAFKPIFKNMMGQLGDNFNFFVFDDEKNRDERIIDPYAEGVFEITYCLEEIKWRTPLGSLLPLKKCPVDNESMNGAWKYCPWHGDKLLK